MSVCGDRICEFTVACEDGGVCSAKVCEATVCGTDPCENLIPFGCGNTMPLTMASCGINTFVPGGRCLGTELYAPTCD